MANSNEWGEFEVKSEKKGVRNSSLENAFIYAKHLESLLQRVVAKK